MTIPAREYPEREPRLTFSDDVFITENQRVSRARDPKTGRLLSQGDDPLPPLLRRVLRPGRRPLR